MNISGHSRVTTRVVMECHNESLIALLLVSVTLSKLVSQGSPNILSVLRCHAIWEKVDCGERMGEGGCLIERKDIEKALFFRQ